jgi:hypothetical protein
MLFRLDRGLARFNEPEYAVEPYFAKIESEKLLAFGDV